METNFEDVHEIKDEIKLRQLYQYVPNDKFKIKNKLKEKLKCQKKTFFSFFLGLFPILKWLPNYSVKNFLPGDIIGGLTTAVVRIPQSLAYGLLAGVQPINGLYTAFFAPLTYAFMGTSKHVSVGTFAIMSLMLESAVEDYEMNYPHVYDNSTLNTTLLESNSTEIMIEQDMKLQHDQYRLQVVTSLTCLIGIFQIGLGMLRMGFVSLFLSDPLVSSFTCASAFHVFTTQIKAVFGVKVPRQPAPFAIVKTYIELFKHITETNVTTIIVSIISIAVLYPVKLINIKYKKKLRSIPIPIELFVVVIATLVSSLLDLDSNNNVDVVGPIQKGLPAPVLPTTMIWTKLISSAFSISVVGFAMTVSLGKLFANKHNYQISPNHELLALGASQIVCSIFQGHACAGALARSSVKESSGTKTQLSDFVSCLVLLLVLLVIGPYLAPLPKTCLACIIIVNLRSLFLQFKQVKKLWKISKPDCAVWIVTFLATLLIGVDTGLFIGVVFLLSSVVMRIYHPSINVQAQLGHTVVYRDASQYKLAQVQKGVRVVRLSQSPFFANKGALQQLTKDLINEINTFHHEVSPNDEIKMKRIVKKAKTRQTSKSESEVETKESLIEMQKNGDDGSSDVIMEMSSDSFHSIVFDCHAWTIMDSVGMETIKQMCKQLSSRNISVYLASLQPSMLDKLIQIDLIDLKNCKKSHVKVFPNVHDAVQHSKISH